MWKTVSSKEIFNHPRLTLIEDEVLLPNGHKTSYLKYKDNGISGVTIIARSHNNKILIQTEYSYPPNQILFQFPGGGVNLGEEIADGANRELMEEAGLKANNLELLGSCFTNNRRSTTKMFVFLATELQEKSLPRDIEEEIESFWFSEDEVTKMIKNGDIVNVNLLAAWALYKSRG